jgi:hypothetical protein
MGDHVPEPNDAREGFDDIEAEGSSEVDADLAERITNLNLPLACTDLKAGRMERSKAVRNIRGFRRKGRRTLLKDYLREHKIDVVLLQETIKQDFSDSELRSLEAGDKFFWPWLPANGQSGGMLIGAKDSSF